MHSPQDFVPFPISHSPSSSLSSTSTAASPANSPLALGVNTLPPSPEGADSVTPSPIGFFPLELPGSTPTLTLDDDFIESVTRLVDVDIDPYVGENLGHFTLDALKSVDIPVDLLVSIAEERAEKKQGSHAKKQPDGHVKRPSNSFIIFRSWFSRCLNINERDHKKISKSAGAVWKQVLTADQKQPFLDASARVTQRHKEKNPDYRYAPGPKKDSPGSGAPRLPVNRKRRVKRSVFDDFFGHRFPKVDLDSLTPLDDVASDDGDSDWEDQKPIVVKSALKPVRSSPKPRVKAEPYPTNLGFAAQYNTSSYHPMVTRRRSSSTPALPSVPSLAYIPIRKKVHHRARSDYASAAPSSSRGVGRLTNNSMSATLSSPFAASRELILSNPIASGSEQRKAHEQRLRLHAAAGSAPSSRATTPAVSRATTPAVSRSTTPAVTPRAPLPYLPAAHHPFISSPLAGPSTTLSPADSPYYWPTPLAPEISAPSTPAFGSPALPSAEQQEELDLHQMGFGLEEFADHFNFTEAAGTSSPFGTPRSTPLDLSPSERLVGWQFPGDSPGSFTAPLPPMPIGGLLLEEPRWAGIYSDAVNRAGPSDELLTEHRGFVNDDPVGAFHRHFADVYPSSDFA